MTRAGWDNYRTSLWCDRSLEMMLDVSRAIESDALSGLEPALVGAVEEMTRLESGAIVNPDEGRMVGHYWLRAPELAPDSGIRQAIVDTVEKVKKFSAEKGVVNRPFTDFLLIGIGGSALGPQLIADALEGNKGLRPHFIDNTDPDGIDRVLRDIGPRLATTLTLIVSKSGGTRETRNGMLEVKAAYEKAGLEFGSHAVAVTGEGSALESTAREEGFLEVFPMWDWVGGRTSVLSAVGLLPAALQGIDIDELLAGAREMDAHTRLNDIARNPAVLLAASWHVAGNGKGDRDMVVLPYKDRLLLLSRYLQQLVMESLGKELDLDGKPVHQGIVVYGNKGSTDQHAYVQQLRDGPDNFFATFIEVLEDRNGPSLDVGGGATAGDYLMGFLLGTREALTERGRASVTITIPGVSPRTVGALIALYERAVGIYAGMVNINAYHQPGVEAGKKAAGKVLELQAKALIALRSNLEREWSIEEVAEETGGDPETLFKILEHAAANLDHGVVARRGEHPTENRYRAS